jgi:hypothetical protein
MNIYIVSRGHAPRMHTAAWVHNLGMKVCVVTHYPDNARDIRKVMPYAKVFWTNMDGLVNSRNYILNNLVKRGAWYVGMDDNILRVTAVHHTLRSCSHLPVTEKVNGYRFGTWRDVYHQDVTYEDGHLLLYHLRDILKKHGTVYGGWSSTENPYFRANRYSYRRFVKSKLFVMRNDPGLEWVGTMGHDSRMSAHVVAQYGRVVVDNYVHPHHKMYESGGLGKDRRAVLDPLLANTIAAYPGLVAKARGANSALRFLCTSDASVERWQQAHGWPRKVK